MNIVLISKYGETSFDVPLTRNELVERLAIMQGAYMVATTPLLTEDTPHYSPIKIIEHPDLIEIKVFTDEAHRGVFYYLHTIENLEG